MTEEQGRRAMRVQSGIKVLATGAALLFGFSGSIAVGAMKKPMEPVDYVSPNIGGIGQLLTATVPYVQTPHGMARLAPITTPEIKDRYLADKTYGFPAGPAMLMISTGKVSTQPRDYASTLTLRRRLRTTMRLIYRAGASRRRSQRARRRHITDSHCLQVLLLIWS
jgi:hypothetical protein